MSISRRRFIATTAATSAALATPKLGSAASTANRQPKQCLNPVESDAVFSDAVFSERARHVLQLANRERLEMQHWYIGSEHLLLGLFAESDFSGTHWLEDTGVHYDDISCVAHYVIGTGDNEISAGKPVQSDNLQACLDSAIDLACESGFSEVQPEHLMLSIVETFGTRANELLQEMWIERGQLRQVAETSLV